MVYINKNNNIKKEISKLIIIIIIIIIIVICRHCFVLKDIDSMWMPQYYINKYITSTKNSIARSKFLLPI